MTKPQKILNTNLPIFLPDATRGVTKGLDSIDLKNSKVRGAVVNTYHLMETPGIEVLKSCGGIKNFMNFDGLIISDSGGWQVFSLIKRNNLPGEISDEGVVFKTGVKNPKQVFTPEKSIEVQFGIGSDVVICLDDFTSPNASDKDIEISVNRTIEWAKRSKEKYETLVNNKEYISDSKPLLFSVIQGGYDKEMRKYCAEKLIEIGFDGYGYGGYVVDEETNQLDLEISKYIVDLIPEDKYKFALGMGKPHDIVALYKMGWEIFDCTLPTRDARHKRLYVENGYVYINKTEYAQDFSPIEKDCDCHTCQNFTKAYLHHLFKIKDFAAYRLATIHNLRFYTKTIENMIEKPVTM